MAVDSAPLIYYLEAVPPYYAAVAPFFEGLLHGRHAAMTSVLTLMEVTARPLAIGRRDLADEHDGFIMGGLRVIDVTPEIARHAAGIRARYGLRPVDALQVATALEHGAGFLLTNDRGFRRVEEIEILLVSG